MKKIEKCTATNSLFVEFLKFYLWLFVAFSTNVPQIKWPGYNRKGYTPESFDFSTASKHMSDK